MERDRYRGEPSNRFAQSPWNRPPPRSFNPRGINGRARTPSPGPSYRDSPRLDVRDRLDLDTRARPSRASWDVDRRWNGRDERFGDESRPPNRRPSPTKTPYRERPNSPPRWRSSSIPRNGPPNASRFGRDRDRPGSSSRDFGESPGPSRQYPPLEGGSTRSSPGADGAARSARGTSSPVPTRIPEPAVVKSEPEEGELEEGEVLSPVRVPREPVREDKSGQWNRNRPRRSPPIGLGRKPSNVPGPRGYRGRPPHVPGGDRPWAPRHVSPTKGPVDNGWNGFARRRVSAEEPSRGLDGPIEPLAIEPLMEEAGQAKDEPTTPPVQESSDADLQADTVVEQVQPVAQQADGERPATPERPPTPPLPVPLAVSPSALAARDASRKAEDDKSPQIESGTPAADIQPSSPSPRPAAEMAAAEALSSPTKSTTQRDSETGGRSADNINDDPETKPAPPVTAIEEGAQVEVAIQTGQAGQPDSELVIEEVNDGGVEAIPVEAEILPVDEPAKADELDTPATADLGTSKDQLKTDSPTPRLPRRAAETRTLAERRSVQLPPTSGPLPPSLVQSDPMLTAVSESTEIWPEPVAEEVRDANLFATVKSAQSQDVQVDADAIMAWNVPSVKTRKILSQKELKMIIQSLDQGVSKRVAMQIAKEQVQNERRVAKLKEEYLQLDKEWQEHCRHLDETMEERGPPPESLYSIPNALPVATPMPSTPAVEEVGRRRRGGLADAVNTEAEFQEILAAMADTAAKDPHYRAAKTTAVVPDMLTPKERLLRHVDENDVVDDPLAFYDFQGVAEAIWTQEEEDIFKRRYLNHPKQFGKIADGIPSKTAGDCVLYYYRTKKEKNWKGQLAMRRGMSTQKRKAPLIKKGGKSAALLANLDAKKPTVDPTPKPKEEGKRKKEPRRKSTLVTPVSTPAEEDEPVKARPKVKRPRMSVVEEPVVPVEAPATVSTELLPPVKRRKHRKVETGDQPEERPKPKRGPTNSYWAKGEKERVKELAATYKTDYKAIASFMPEKTERQIMNHMRDHLVEWGLAEPEKPSGPFSRSIYDVYNGGPRLGVFPPLPRPEAQAPTPQVEPVPISRPGGMRISALLNDDPLPPRVDNTDNQSDVTVDEEDTRRSPVNFPQVAQQPRHEYPRQGEYRSVSSGSYTQVHPARNEHVADLSHRYPETMRHSQHPQPPVPYYEYAQAYDYDSTHSDAYRSMMAERAYNRANVAVDYRSSYDRWHEERAQRERTYAAAAAMPPLHHPQPHHSMYTHHHPSHPHAPARPDSSHTMSPHLSHALAVQRMSPHMQAGMHRSPFEPERVPERLPSIHSVMDDRRD